MLVSAVIPTFNRRQYLCRAIDSIVAQTLPVDEIIVVDDGSTDGSAELIETKYGSQVRIVRQEHSGVSVARHRGVAEATGEWIAFLDSDDEWMPQRNAEFVRAIAVAPSTVAWIFGDLQVVTDTGSRETIFQKRGLTICSKLHVFADPLSTQFPFQFSMLQGSVIRKNVLEYLGCFTEHLNHSEDVLAGYKVATKHRFAAIPSIVTKIYRTSDLVISSTELRGRATPDYHLARMAGFSLIATSGTLNPWGELYAEEVRKLCKLLARRGEPFRRLARDQFRFRTSPKSLLFLAACMAGATGLKAWRRLAKAARECGIESNQTMHGVERSVPTGRAKPGSEPSIL